MITGSNCGVKPNSKGEREQKGFENGLVQINVGGEHGDNKQQGQFHEHVAETTDAMLELRFRGAGAQFLGKAAELRVLADVDDKGCRRAADNVRTHIQAIRPVTERGIGGKGSGRFFRRERFAGQRGLVYGQDVGFQYQTVTGNDISRAE